MSAGQEALRAPQSAIRRVSWPRGTTRHLLLPVLHHLPPLPMPKALRGAPPNFFLNLLFHVCLPNVFSQLRFRTSHLTFSPELLIHVELSNASSEFRFVISPSKVASGPQPKRSRPNPSSKCPFIVSLSTLRFQTSFRRVRRRSCVDVPRRAKIDPGALRAPRDPSPRSGVSRSRRASRVTFAKGLLAKGRYAPRVS